MVSGTTNKHPSDSSMISSHNSEHQYPSQSLQPPPTPRTPRFLKRDIATPLDSLGIRLWSSALQPTPERQMATIGDALEQGAYSVGFTVSYAAGQENWGSYDDQVNCQYELPPQEMGMSEEFPKYDSTLGCSFEQRYTSETHECTTPANNLTALEGHMVSTGEATTVIDLRMGPTSQRAPLNMDQASYRRLSASSFVSSAAAANDMPDMATPSEVPSYPSEYTPRSSLDMSVNPISPVRSPRSAPRETNRTGNWPIASPSPRSGMRPAPYTLGGARNSRWSTGSYSPASTRRTTPMCPSAPEDYFALQPRLSSIKSPCSAPSTYAPSSTLDNNPDTNFVTESQCFHQPRPLLPSTLEASPRFEGTPLAPQGHFRTLQSNADQHDQYSDHYTSFSDPPDLYSGLVQARLPPPMEDMQAFDACLVPHEQELRFDGDLYTPKYVRGAGNKREGWCGICKPGRWLVLKNSAFWYDKSFTHGISATTGQAFAAPTERRRTGGNAEIWEGLCGTCGEWVALVSSKKRGTTWFRHAYKCHSHQRVRDVPRRRRENSRRPAMAKSTASPKPKVEYPLPAA